MTTELTLDGQFPLKAIPSRLLCVAEYDGLSTTPVVGHVGDAAQLPVGLEVPQLTCRNGGKESLSHIATFSTEVLSDVAPGLPAGKLVLLYAASEQPWTYVCHKVNGERDVTDDMNGMKDGHRIVFVPEGAETVAYAGGTQFPRRDLHAVEGDLIELANPDDLMKLSDDACDKLDEIEEETRDAILGDLRQAITVKGPVECIQNDIMPVLPELGEVVRGMDSVEDDWICIAQVATLGGYQPAVPGSFCFGDEGMIYFCVTKADLAAMRFDRTICILQCG